MTRPKRDRAGDLHARGTQLLLQVEGRRVPFHAWVGGHDHLPHSPASHPVQQWPDPQISRTDSFDRRQHSVQHVVAAIVGTDAFECHHIQCLLHNTQHSGIPIWIIADLALGPSGACDVEAILTERNLGLQSVQGLGELFRDLIRSPQEKESQP